MNQVFLGIDPGESGALAAIENTLGSLTAYTWDFDDPAGLEYLIDLRCRALNPHAVLEKVSAMPKQGVSSTFKFGTNYGRWMGRLEIMKIPFDLVTPRTWQKKIFDSAPVVWKWVGGTANSQKGIPKEARDIHRVPKGAGSVWKFRRKTPDTKAMSLERSRRLFPQLGAMLKRKKDNGRADALLIAEFCRLNCQNGVVGPMGVEMGPK